MDLWDEDGVPQERGYHVLTFDGPGQPAAIHVDGLPFRPDRENVVGPVLDFLIHLVLFSPVTDAAFDTSSYHQFAEGYFLRRDGMQWFWDQYTTNPAERAQITASPLRATTEQLTGLPQALVITAEADVLRDEGEAYANKLRTAGVPVTAVRYQGIIHDFVMLNALRETHAADAAINQAINTLRTSLGTA